MVEYTTERGIDIGIVPIPFLLDRIREEAKKDEPPTLSYTEHLAGGAEQEREITREMAAAWMRENPESWAEHSEMWVEYMAAWMEWDSQVDDQIWNAIALEAIKVELPTDDGWKERQQRFYGLDVPDGPDALRIHYVDTEVMGGPKDYVKVTTIANGGDIGEDALAIAEAAFRGVLQGQVDKGLQDLEEDGALDDEPADGGSEDGETVGQDAD